MTPPAWLSVAVPAAVSLVVAVMGLVASRRMNLKDQVLRDLERDSKLIQEMDRAGIDPASVEVLRRSTGQRLESFSVIDRVSPRLTRFWAILGSVAFLWAIGLFVMIVGTLEHLECRTESCSRSR